MKPYKFTRLPLLTLTIMLNLSCSAFLSWVDPTYPRGAEATLLFSPDRATYEAAVSALEASDAQATNNAGSHHAGLEYGKIQGSYSLGTASAAQATAANATYSAKLTELDATLEASDAYATWRAANATYYASEAMVTYEAAIDIMATWEATHKPPKATPRRP